MKGIFASLFVFLAVMGNLQSQTVCCPYVGKITIAPANPTTTDSILIITTTTTPGLGHQLYYNYYLQNDTIYLNGCFFDGMPAQPKLYIDTTVIGPLTSGTYFISYVAKISYSPIECIVEDSKSMSTLFEVTSVTKIEDVNEIQFKIYPNPVKDFVLVEQNNLYTDFKIELINSVGQLCLSSTYTEKANIDISKMRKGFYTIIITTEKNRFFYKLIKD
jgi:hypothetical protein